VSCIAGAMVFYKKLPRLKTLVKPLYDKMDMNPDVAAELQLKTEPTGEAADII
jgi:hypothetical protein